MHIRLVFKVICAVVAVVRWIFWFIQESRIQNIPSTTVYIIEQNFFLQHSMQIKDVIQTQVVSGNTYGIVLAATWMYYILPPTQDSNSIVTYSSAITQQSFVDATQEAFTFPSDYRIILFGTRNQSLADQMIGDGTALQNYQQTTLTDSYQQNKKWYSYWYVIIYALIVMWFLLL